MASQAHVFQSLLALLLSEPDLIVELHTDPEAFAAAHGADSALVNRLCALDRDRLRVSAQLIAARRRWLMLRSLPASAALLDRLSREDEAVKDAAEQVRPWEAREEKDFARLMTRVAEALPATGPALALREVIKFEVLLGELRELGGQLADRAAPGSRAEPAMSPRVRAANFELPVAETCRRILAGGPHTDVAPRRTCYVLSAEEGARTRTSVVPQVLYDVLRLCDGIRTTGEIARHLNLSQGDVEGIVRVARAKAFLLTP